MYDSTADLPDPAIIDDFDASLDDYILVPYDQVSLLDNVDHSIQLDFEMDNLGNGAN